MKTAVAYLRVSSELNDKSVSQQKHEVQQYAKFRDYKIAEFYVDDGKSGSKDTEARVSFMRMLQDAVARKFEVIVCYDTSRFGRLDSSQSGQYTELLRKSGVILDTVKNGIIDWNDSTSRINWAINAELNNAPSIKASHDVIRGRTFLLQEGFWVRGDVPYGYDKLYVDGTTTTPVARTAKYNKGRGVHLKLTANSEAQVVRRIFTEFATTDISLRQLAYKLSKDAIPTKTGRSDWNHNLLSEILTEKAYCGIATLGEGRRTTSEAHNRCKPTSKEGSVPAIIDVDTFQKVQNKLAARADYGKRTKTEHVGLFSGYAICGHCGYKLSKAMRHDKVYYSCQQISKTPTATCKQWRIHESELLPKVVAWLIEKIDWQYLDELQAVPPDTAITDLTVSQQLVDTLRKDLEKATRRFAVADDDLADLLAVEVRRLKSEVADAEQRLALARIVHDLPQVEQDRNWWKSVRETLVTFQSQPHPEAGSRDCVEVEPAALREFFRQLGLSVTVWWCPALPKRQRSRVTFRKNHEVQKVEIAVNTQHSVGADSSIGNHKMPLLVFSSVIQFCKGDA